MSPGLLILLVFSRWLKPEKIVNEIFILLCSRPILNAPTYSVNESGRFINKFLLLFHFDFTHRGSSLINLQFYYLTQFLSTLASSTIYIKFKANLYN